VEKDLPDGGTPQELDRRGIPNSCQLNYLLVAARNEVPGPSFAFFGWGAGMGAGPAGAATVSG